MRKSDGEGHAVLAVRTDKGDFILDNLTNRVRPWYETNHHYLKRQAEYNTRRWVSILSEDNLLVGALR
ncbi:transglutaminase-like cysteine peptidase [Mesorhizobium sp. M0622]